MCCKKCTLSLGIIIFLVGLLFLLKDLNVWAFWDIQWWTVAFIMAGIAGVCSSLALCA